MQQPRQSSKGYYDADGPDPKSESSREKKIFMHSFSFRKLFNLDLEIFLSEDGNFNYRSFREAINTPKGVDLYTHLRDHYGLIAERTIEILIK